MGMGKQRAKKGDTKLWLCHSSSLLNSLIPQILEILASFSYSFIR